MYKRCSGGIEEVYWGCRRGVVGCRRGVVHVSQCPSKSVFGPLKSVFRDLCKFFEEFEVLGIDLGFLKCEIGLSV